MCGVVAVFAYKPNAADVERDHLLKIREAMVARGPDGAGLWIAKDGRTGLAHRRLAILDLTEAAAQPMSNADASLRIVFNGEIYNYRALRKYLEESGFRFFSNSDTEVLLNLYAKEGAGMMRHLRGMYAFAIWDERKRGLFVARDPFGIKPLYYADDGSSIQIASQVKALLRGGKVNTAKEPAGHVGFFLWGYVPEPFTLYKGIKSLPAGSTLWIDEAGHHEIKKFFDFSGFLKPTPVFAEETKYNLASVLLDSVRHHLVADVPVGVFCSAGLDSTTLVALAAETGVQDLRTITLGFKEYQGTDNDETILAEVVAKRYRTDHKTIWVTEGDFQQNFDHLIESMDQPSIDGVNTYFVCKAAAENGLKTALSGLGGDEFFGGYPSFENIPRIVRSTSFSRFIPGFGKGFRLVSAPILKHLTSPKYAGLFEYGYNYGGAYMLRRGLYMPWELPDILDADLVKKGWEDLSPMINLERRIEGVDSARQKISTLELTCYMRDQLLRDADWAGMAHSLEVRVPFVDIEVLKNIMPRQATLRPPTKQEMAGIPSRPLPKAVLVRNKTGFAIPVHEWMRHKLGYISERGLRGWGKTIYRTFGEEC